MDEEFKNCPFCGSTSNYWTQNGRYGLFAYVECDICGARTKTVQSYANANEDEFWGSIAHGKLRSLWNRRCKDAE